MTDTDRLCCGCTSLLADISAGAVSMTDFSAFLQESLERIGTMLHVDRVYLVALSEEGLWGAVHEWTASGVASQTYFRSGGAAGDFWLGRELAAGRQVHCTQLAGIPDSACRELLRQQNVTSLLAVPVRQQGRIAAVFALERHAGPMNWPSEAADLVVSIAHTLLVARSKADMSAYITAQRSQLEDILNTVPGKIWLTEFDSFKILSANQEMFKAFGADILGKKCYKVFQNLDEPCSFCLNNLIRETSEPQTRVQHSEALGRTLQVTARCIVLPDGKKVRISHLSDMTDLLQIQQEKMLAERAAQAKADFLARMSHEIRTPMNAIIGFTHLLSRTQLDTYQQDYLNKTRIAANGLLHIINDILDFSRIEAGKMTVERVPFKLSVLLAAVQSIVGFSAREKNLDFTVEIAPDVPALLRGDPGRVNQVLINLLGNAVKFTSTGRVGLYVSATHGPGAEVTLHCRVEDTGIGMPPEQAALLFQPFTQADGSVARRFGGTGLGLAISKRLVELMGGTISVTSQPGQGTTFFFTLTAEAGDAGDEPDACRHDLDKAPSDEVKARLARIQGSRILVVDDNDINLEIARELLESLGMLVVEAGGGEESVTKACGDAFDLVFMDMQMPDVDGLEATRRIRRQSLQTPRIAALPIVAMTANVLAVDRERCFEAGMNDHIAKPLDMNELIYCLLHWIAPRDDSGSECT